MASRVLSSFNASSLNLQFLKHSVNLMLIQQFNYRNIKQVPQLDRIVVNYGVGEVAKNPKGMAVAMHDLALITGQKPAITGAAKVVDNRPREKELPLAMAVTLRGKMMYSFLERVINLGLPRMIDFQGATPNSFDGRGNYRLALREQSVFEELKDHILGKPRPLHIHIATTATTDKEAERLLALMGMPFGDGEGGRAKTIKKKKKPKTYFDSKAKARAQK